MLRSSIYDPGVYGIEMSDIELVGIGVFVVVGIGVFVGVIVGGGKVEGGRVGTAVVGMGMTVGVEDNGRVQADKTKIKLTTRNENKDFLNITDSFLAWQSSR